MMLNGISAGSDTRESLSVTELTSKITHGAMI